MFIRCHKEEINFSSSIYAFKTFLTKKKKHDGHRIKKQKKNKKEENQKTKLFPLGKYNIIENLIIAHAFCFHICVYYYYIQYKIPNSMYICIYILVTKAKVVKQIKDQMIIFVYICLTTYPL